MVVDDALDVALLLEERNGATSERTVDLHAVNEDRLRDELVGRDLLEDAVAGMLVRVLGEMGVIAASSYLFDKRSNIFHSQDPLRLTRSAGRGRRRCWPCP